MDNMLSIFYLIKHGKREAAFKYMKILLIKRA